MTPQLVRSSHAIDCSSQGPGSLTQISSIPHRERNSEAHFWGGLARCMPSSISQFSYTRPVDTSAQLKRFGISTVLRSGHQTRSCRQGTNRRAAAACNPSGGSFVFPKTKNFVPERTPRAAAQPIEIPFSLYEL
jgi:hypothetical protein